MTLLHVYDNIVPCPVSAKILVNILKKLHPLCIMISIYFAKFYMESEAGKSVIFLLQESDVMRNLF